MKKFTITEMKEICKENESHYFDKETIKFWGSKVINTYANGLFIESIDDFTRTKKLYKVAMFTKDGKVLTIDKDEKNSFYDTLESAKIVVKNLNYAFKNNLGYREKDTLENISDIHRDENYQNYLKFISEKNSDNSSYSFILDNNYQVRG